MLLHGLLPEELFVVKFDAFIILNGGDMLDGVVMHDDASA